MVFAAGLPVVAGLQRIGRHLHTQMCGPQITVCTGHGTAAEAVAGSGGRVTLLPEPALCYPAAAQLWGGNTRLRVLSRAASAFFACRTEFQYAPPVRMPYHPPAG